MSIPYGYGSLILALMLFLLFIAISVNSLWVWFTWLCVHTAVCRCGGYYVSIPYGYGSHYDSILERAFEYGSVNSLWVWFTIRLDRVATFSKVASVNSLWVWFTYQYKGNKFIVKGKGMCQFPMGMVHKESHQHELESRKLDMCQFPMGMVQLVLVWVGSLWGAWSCQFPMGMVQRRHHCAADI